MRIEQESSGGIIGAAVRLCASSLGVLALAACASVPSPIAQTPVRSAPIEIQILALNDFHGRLAVPDDTHLYRDADGEDQREQLGGAAQLGATLMKLREGQEHSITVAAGDLIGASPLESAYFLDEPTILALNAIGLEIASVGNHEFDRGVEELRRMQSGGCERFTIREPCALDTFEGAHFTYLAGNTVSETGETVFPGTSLRHFGPVTIGFVGLTLKDTAKLVSPAATAGYRFLDEAETANEAARRLLGEGADAVVLLIHEGANVEPRYNLSGCPELGGAIVPIIERLDPSIRLVVSGHTHQAYTCELPVSGGKPRVLTSAGRYGAFATDIRLAIDPASGELLSIGARNVPVRQDAGEQADVAMLVRRYVEAAGPIANRQVGPIAPASSIGEDCADSPQQDLVADAQLHASEDKGAQIAFINSGGVRTDLTSAEDGVLTYGEIFAMQPFGNALVVLELTGVQIRSALEEQFCGENGEVRPCFSLLTGSRGLAYAFDRDRPAGERIIAMTLHDEPVDPARLYRVTVNNFLSNGGDGFDTLAAATAVGGAGIDVDALESYIATGGVSVPVCGRVRDVTGL
jgi:5'-nucleotidase